MCNLRIRADIGVHEHEIGRPQELLINAVVELYPLGTDKISDTPDYTHIVAFAEQLGRQRIALIETFAHRLAEACLAHPLAERADICVSKPGALRTGLAGARTVLRKAG